MDNFALDIVSEGQESFRLAMQIALSEHRSASHYAVVERPCPVNEFMKPGGKRKALVLFWHDHESFSPRPTPFPCPMKGKALDAFVWAWLEDAWEKGFHGQQPDHDGDNSNAWRVFNEAWGHVADSPYAFVAIQPVWAMHGK